MSTNTTRPRRVLYSMIVSLDGFVNGPNGELDWHIPDEDLHTFLTEQQDEVGAYLLGRRMYEVMDVWDTVDADSDVPEYELEFARAWQSKDKVVFSRTLESVPPNVRLARGDVPGEVDRLRRQRGLDIEVSGPGLAASLMEHDLIDEYRLFVHPVVVGGGTPFFPPGQRLPDLRLIETHPFKSGVVYLRYQTGTHG